MDKGQLDGAAPREIYLKDYTPPPFTVDRVSLLFELGDTAAEVTSTVSYVRHAPDAPDLVLDGGPYMTLLSVRLDGRDLTTDGYRLEDEALTIFNVPDRFTLELRTGLKPAENTRLEGLYQSGGNYCTQCEAEGFRHITYFPDRPDVMAVYDVRLEADKESYPVLLSNGNPGQTGELEGGRHFAEWHDPFPKPSYLFALVAGKLAFLSDSYTTASGRDIQLNIYATDHDLDKCGHAMQSLKDSMKWDEDVYGLEYDLDVYNILAVGDFNMGAMENKGLNIFNTKYVLASPETATDSDFDHVQGVIGHEYFHNWTGNRVTCRDWFQLSLKEGLTVFRDQEFSSDMGSRPLKRIDDVRMLRAAQFPEDAGPLAHPIRPDHYVEINNFYTATVYNKGAEVIRMMHRLIGADAFRRGMDLYFDRHDGQAVTCDDFVQAMEDASGKDLSQFRLWYAQAGTPEVSIERERTANGDIVLKVMQTCPDTPGQSDKAPFHLPLVVGWVGPDGRPVEPDADHAVSKDGSYLLELTEREQSFRFSQVPEGAVPSLLRSFSAPVKLENDLSKAEKLFLMRHDQDSFVRWEMAQELCREDILRLVDVFDVGGNDTAPDGDMIEAFRTILMDTETDPTFVAELLTMPSENDIGQFMGVLRPESIHAARQAFIKTLANRHERLLRERYDACTAHLQGIGEYNLTLESKANRRLRNTLLGYLHHVDDGENICTDHFQVATNMTDQIASLSVIANSNFESRKDCLHHFYETWKGEDLVIDKWFMVQAVSRQPNALDEVERLSQHPDFLLKNPNRMRSLVLMFAAQNQLHFHEKEGRGYRFLSDMITRVDAINPQVAARLVAPLGRWKRVGPGRQVLMKTALRAILSCDGVSNDVSEMVSKSLGE